MEDIGIVEVGDEGDLEVVEEDEIGENQTGEGEEEETGEIMMEIGIETETGEIEMIEIEITESEIGIEEIMIGGETTEIMMEKTTEEEEEIMTEEIVTEIVTDPAGPTTIMREKDEEDQRREADTRTIRHLLLLAQKTGVTMRFLMLLTFTKMLPRSWRILINSFFLLVAMRKKN